MIRLILTLLWTACQAPAPPAPPPAPVTQVHDPELEDIPPPQEPWPLPEMPNDCCVFELFVPSSGYTLRIWPDGTVTVRWGDGETQAIVPYDHHLANDPAAVRLFVAEQQSSWAAELSTPWVNPGLEVQKLPMGREYDPQPMVLRTRKGRRVITLEIVADTDHRPSFGRLEAAWTALDRRLRPPRR